MNNKYLWFISISTICIEEPFMTPFNLTPFVKQVYCWIIYSDLLPFMKHAYFLSSVFTIFGETMFPLCLGWRVLFIFLYLL